MASLSVSIHVPADAVHVRAARKSVESLLCDHGFAVDRIASFALALSEALFNALDHGGAENGIDLEVNLLADRAEAAVDNASLDAEAPVDDLADLLAEAGVEVPDANVERGRGLHLMATRADEVRCESLADGRTRIVLVLKR
ncbi:MAG: ATP-binding protein [Planctomycetes bacterium]|nr:ATP-binding protein [Planctomycetota bacterium]